MDVLSLLAVFSSRRVVGMDGWILQWRNKDEEDCATHGTEP
jgi:hypothetical protein